MCWVSHFVFNVRTDDSVTKDKETESLQNKSSSLSQVLSRKIPTNKIQNIHLLYVIRLFRESLYVHPSSPT